MKTARILVPPGIGDGYWVLTKLRGFMEREGIGRAEVWVHDSDPRRSEEMWRRAPLVEWGGYAAVPKRGRGGQALARAYRRPGNAVQRRVCGFDYFLSLNGTLDAGRSMDAGIPGPTNWYEPMHDEVATEERATAFRARFGPYVVTTFWDHGWYRELLEHFSEAAIVETLRRLADAGFTVVVMGAAWDRGSIADRVAAADPRFMGLVGETDYDGLCGLLAGSQGIFGFPAGNTLIGPYFRRPTVLMWGHFPRAMWTNACPPDPEYRPLDAQTATPESVAAEVCGMIDARLSEAA